MSGRALAVALLAVAFALRLAVVLADADYRPATDPADYDRHARSIAAGRGYPDTSVAAPSGPTAGRQPAYPYLLGAVYAAWPGDDVQAARVVQALLGTVTVAVIGLIGLQLWGRTAGLAALAAGAVFPPLVVVGAALLSEAFFLPLMLGAVAAVLAARESPARAWPLVAGLLFGAAVMTRSAGVVLAPLLAWGMWSGAGRSLARPVLLLGVAALCCVPWIVRNAAAFDDPPPLTTQTGYVAGGTYNDVSKSDPVYPAAWRPPLGDADYASVLRDPGVDEADVDRAWRTEARREIASDPLYVGEVMFWNTVRWLHLAQREYAHTEDNGLDRGLETAGVIGFLVMLPLALAGALTRRARRAPPWFWLCPVAIWITTVALAGFIRYRAPVDPFVAMLAALGAVAAYERLRRRASTKQNWVPSPLVRSTSNPPSAAAARSSSRSTAEPSQAGSD
jgi:4-amino-4-deoxy-L-arabinose transferase-like glycosyltransferase